MSITLTHKKIVTVMEQESIEHHDLIMRIHDQILNYGPHHFNMQTWCTVADPDDDGYDTDENTMVGKQSLEGIIAHDIDLGHCGTTACLAGHAVSYMARNGLTDAIVHTGWSVPSVDNIRLAELMGIPLASFASERYDWHPVTQAAYLADLGVQAYGCTVNIKGWNDHEGHSPVPVTVDWINGEQGPSDAYRVKDTHGFSTPWVEWVENAKHHAEWVAMLTYLRWIAMLSLDLHNCNTVHASEGDTFRITQSPAFETYHDARERVERELRATDEPTSFTDDDILNLAMDSVDAAHDADDEDAY